MNPNPTTKTSARGRLAVAAAAAALTIAVGVTVGVLAVRANPTQDSVAEAPRDTAADSTAVASEPALALSEASPPEEVDAPASVTIRADERSENERGERDERDERGGEHGRNHAEEDDDD